MQITNSLVSKERVSNVIMHQWYQFDPNEVILYELDGLLLPMEEAIGIQQQTGKKWLS